MGATSALFATPNPTSEAVPISDGSGSLDAWVSGGSGGTYAGPIELSGLTMDHGFLLGRYSTGSGAIQEITVGSGLSLVGSVLSSVSSGSGGVFDLQAALDALSSTRGAILFRGASAWQALAPGTSGYILTTSGSGADPVWSSPIDADIAFDTAATNSNVTLSGSNRTATRSVGSGNGGVARALGGKSTGKWYVEFVAGAAASGGSAFGLVLSTFNPLGSTYIGDGTTSWGYWSSGNRYFNGSPTAGFSAFAVGVGTDVIGIAWDAGAGKLWFAKNNVWQGSGDPATGANASYSSVSGTGYAAANVYDNATVATIRRPSNNSYSPPSGFTAWTT